MTEVRDKEAGLSVPSGFSSAITATLRQHNYKHLPCSQSFTRLVLMDISHTGDSVLLPPRHLTLLYLGLPRQQGKAVLLMTICFPSPTPPCSKYWYKTRAYEHTDLCTHTPKKLKDMASHSPLEKDDTSAHSYLSTHINILYTHTEVTENTL